MLEIDKKTIFIKKNILAGFAFFYNAFLMGEMSFLPLEWGAPLPFKRDNLKKSSYDKKIVQV